VNFRRIPAPAGYDDEVAAEPYWSMGANDVFPEQFDRFLVSAPDLREVFYAHHRDLLDPEFWTRKQQAVCDGLQEDVFPYPEEIRFAREPGGSRSG
jgi:isocitrate dehydrogenase kinase/phosphatase